MTRAAMFLLAQLSMNLLLGVLVLAVARGERASRALRLWGWGLVVYALSMVFFVVRIPELWNVSLVAGNALICLAAMLTTLGIYEHTPMRANLLLIVGGFLIAVLAVSATHLFGLSIVIDIAAPTIYASALYVTAAGYLIWQPPAAARAAARFMGTAILVVVLIWNVRLVAIWLSMGGTQDTARADFMVSAFAIVQILALVSCTLGLIWIEVRLMESDLRRAAYRDLLTDVPNRRAMHQRFEEEVARARRLNEPFGLVLFDVDDFKQINDTRGHHVGDSVLREVARAMEKGKRTEDVLGRIGGEEFLVLLPHHDRTEALAAAERLRHAVEETSQGSVPDAPAATVSGGVAVFPDDGEDWDRLFMAADRRMYRAKGAGRNRVIGRGV